MSIDLEYAIKKDIRNNPIVREVDLQQKRDFIRTLSIVAAIVGMLLFSAWQHFEIVKQGYRVESLRQAQAQEEAINRQLRLDLETLRRPQEIERRARQELHMEPAAARDTVVLERVPAHPAVPSRAIVAEHR
jgi:hypothetical protein